MVYIRKTVCWLHKDFHTDLAAFAYTHAQVKGLKYRFIGNGHSELVSTLFINSIKTFTILLKHYSKKDSGTTLETSNIKIMRIALKFQSISGL